MNNMEEKEERKETGIRIKDTRLAGAREQSSEDLCSPDFWEISNTHTVWNIGQINHNFQTWRFIPSVKK